MLFYLRIAFSVSMTFLIFWSTSKKNLFQLLVIVVWTQLAITLFLIQQLNVYSVHPFFMALDNQNNAFGVFFRNSNAQGEILD